MPSEEIRKKFKAYFEKNGHAWVPSSSLVPDDPSVLLTTAGMQQFKKYYTGDADATKDFGSRSTASIQKSFRTSDIDEVGDETHLTFFEMLGNFSFGGYWKKDAIKYGYDFITKELGLKISYVTVFKGANGVPKDEESKAIWKSLDADIEVREEGMEDVFWGPTGSAGPCGPTTEIYCKNANGKDVEIWNIVFNEFFCDGPRDALLAGTAKLSPLETKGIDTGMGLERLTMIAQNKKTIFETDLLYPTIDFLEKNITTSMSPWSKRIVADHIRGIVFLIADGVFPSNRQQGYILRRIMRRVMPHLLEFQLFEPIMKGQPRTEVHVYHTDGLSLVAKNFIEIFSDVYPYLKEKERDILKVIKEENEKFSNVYREGEKILDKLIIQARTDGSDKISGKDIFDLVTVHGFSLEWIKDKAKTMHALDLDIDGFDKEFEKHKELSRTSSAGMFKGGLADTSERTVKLHTAHHLLLKALQIVLGPQVKQRGSNITSERLRLDFSYDQKITDEQKKAVEKIVNEKIAEDLPVLRNEMAKEDAEKLGAEHEFGQKYGDRVSVYSIGPKGATLEKPQFDKAYSIEFCGGPHVAHTGEIGHFTIAKEEASGSGVRRIRGVID